MSPVRAHFCTLVARLNSGTASPRKYGLNWFMPALASSRLASAGISELEGTRRCPRSTKKSVNRRRISIEFMSWNLARRHRRPPLLERGGEPPAQLVGGFERAPAQRRRREPLRRPRRPAYRAGSDHGAEADAEHAPEQPPHRRHRLRRRGGSSSPSAALPAALRSP